MSARKLSEPPGKAEPQRAGGVKRGCEMERLLVDIATSFIDVPPERSGDAMTGALE